MKEPLYSQTIYKYDVIFLLLVFFIKDVSCVQTSTSFKCFNYNFPPTSSKALHYTVICYIQRNQPLNDLFHYYTSLVNMYAICNKPTINLAKHPVTHHGKS
jgi:hypothetical protein